MNKQQIVTIELVADGTSIELFHIISKHTEILYQVFGNYRDILKEMLIVSLADRVFLYAFTSDYSPILRVFQALDIPPNNLRIIVNTKDTCYHVFSLITERDTRIKSEKYMIATVRNAYEIARVHGFIGEVLESLLIDVLRNQRIVRRETILGKLFIRYTEKILARIENIENETIKEGKSLRPDNFQLEPQSIDILSQLIAKKTV